MTDKLPVSDDLNRKLENLKNVIRRSGSLAVGFSGGVDSTFLLTVAHEVLGDKAIAVTCADAPAPKRETEEAESFCRERGIRQISFKINPLSMDEFRRNVPDRCYYCKRAVFSRIIEIAKENGIEYAAEGSNKDDLQDYRPGLRAVEELKVISPLREADLYKAEIRQLSQAMGLPTWNKPSCACLASRFVYGEEITEEKILMVDKAEQYLIDRGFARERVRMHGSIARIEVPPEDISRLASEEIRQKVYEKLREIGFLYVTLDLKGYETGSMNKTIK